MLKFEKKNKKKTRKFVLELITPIRQTTEYILDKLLLWGVKSSDYSN